MIIRRAATREPHPDGFNHAAYQVNLADVFYRWPLINFCRFIKLQISFTICMFLPFKAMFLNYQFRLFIYFEFSATFQRACL